MKRLLQIILVIIPLSRALTGFAQSPQGINYQGVARDTDGKPFASKPLAIRISILKNSDHGEVEFSETHAVTTNPFGLFNLVIGQGTTITGSFAFVSWAIGTKWLQVEMDAEGGNNFEVMGAQQLMTVPYSFYSQYSGNGLQAGQGINITNGLINNTGDADNNASNELNTSMTFGADHKLKITDAGGTLETDLSGINQNLSQVLQSGNDAGALKISNLGTPVSPSDAATKAYTDAHVDADASASNEIQDLNLTANTLKITNNPAATAVSLSPYLDNTDAQTLSLSGSTLSISGGNGINISGINTDSQNLSLSAPAGTNRTIGISGGTGVTFDVADNDNNSSNEIQDLSLVTNVLKITNNAAASSINLVPYLDNTDGQTLTLSGNTLSISGGNNVNLTGINTDAQNLTLGASTGTGRTINISGGTGVAFDVADNDNNPSNEIQDLSLTSNTLKITNNAAASGINLAPYLDNTDNQNLSLGTVTGTAHTINISGGTSIALDVADNDSNPSNEIQDLSLTSNTLKITNNAAASSINLAPYLDNTDNQNLSLGTVTGTAHTINISGGTAIALDVADNDNNPSNEIQDLSLTSNTLKITNNAAASSISLAPYLDNTDNQTLSYTAGTNSLAISGGNSVIITHTLNQVLTQGNDAGGKTITNVGTPVGSSDVTTRGYVDNAVATNFSFKTSYAFSNTGTSVTDQPIALTESIDDFNVVGSNKFTVPPNGAGVYMFFVDGSSSNTSVTIKLRVNGTTLYPVKRQTTFPSPLLTNDMANIMLKLSAGDILEVVVESHTTAEQASGFFFGYKL